MRSPQSAACLAAWRAALHATRRPYFSVRAEATAMGDVLRSPAAAAVRRTGALAPGRDHAVLQLQRGYLVRGEELQQRAHAFGLLAGAGNGG